MAFENRVQGQFFTIFGGRFCQRVPEGTVGAVSRVNKLGKTVYERYHDSFTGKLVGIKTQDGEYGKSWLFSFKDKNEVYHLQLPYSGSFSSQFLKILPNVDLSQEMRVSPSQKEVDGKMKSSLFINQNGNPVKHAYTKDNPNGLPPLEQVTVKGQQVWDDTKQLEFLYNMVATTIIPKLEGVPETPAQAPSEQTQADKDFDNFGKQGEAQIDGEDVPF